MDYMSKDAKKSTYGCILVSAISMFLAFLMGFLTAFTPLVVTCMLAFLALLCMLFGLFALGLALYTIGKEYEKFEASNNCPQRPEDEEGQTGCSSGSCC